MRVLVMGGTRFVGRAITERLLERNHTVTLVHRGKTGGDLFPEARHITLDRTADQAALGNELCDVVIDVSGQTGPMVRETVRLMQGRATHYIFISTISVYNVMDQPDMDETGSVFPANHDDTDVSNGARYGARKVACEEAVLAAFPNALIARPGLIIGPYDYMDRMPYWVRRLAQGGAAVVPDRLDQPVQLIDVRDLADWVVRGAETKLAGVYNLVGPQTTLGAVLEACRTPDTTLAPLPEAFLLEQGVEPFADLPFWTAADFKSDGLLQMSHARAVASGLNCRPLAESVAAVRAWEAALELRPLQLGLTPEREAALLAAWQTQQG